MVKNEETIANKYFQFKKKKEIVTLISYILSISETFQIPFVIKNQLTGFYMRATLALSGFKTQPFLLFPNSDLIQSARKRLTVVF